jgi:hypothetical protein
VAESDVEIPVRACLRFKEKPLEMGEERMKAARVT